MNTMKAFLLIAASAIAMTSGPGARAQVAAWEFAAPGNSFSNGSWNFGANFTTTQAFTVTALGFYNDASLGIDTSYGNPVALYTSTGGLLAQATVVASDPQIGNFVYAPITPIVLAAGSYQIDGVSNNSNYTWNDPGFATAPGVIYDGNTWTPVNLGDPPAFQNYVQNDVTDGYWGPNLLLTPYAPGPVPGAGLAGLAALALAGLYERTRRA